MYWENLKNLTCPKCEADLVRSESNKNMFWCSVKACDFSISEERLREIVEPMFADDHYGRADFEELMEAEK